MPGREQLLRDLYVAFNARDAEAVLAALSEEVDWPNAWQGGRLHGRAAVREYWARQWSEVDPTVEPVAFATRPDGRIEVTVAQTVRSLEGALLAQSTVLHVYALAPDGHVTRMDIEEPNQPST